MRHKLARQVGGYHIHMEFVEVEIHAYRLHGRFQPAIGTEVPLTGSHKNAPSSIFKTEYDNSNQACHSKNTEQHLAEHLEVSAKCHQIAIVSNFFILKVLMLFPYLFFRFLLLFPFLAFLLRHSLLAPRPTVRSYLS